MIVRPYSPLDWDVIGPWFNARPAYGKVDLSILLPVNGWVVEDESGPIAACWVYLPDAAVAWLEWCVTRPKSGLPGIRALEAGIKEAKKFAGIAGYAAMFQFMPDERLVNYYERRCGFQKVEQGTLMIAGLEGE